MYAKLFIIVSIAMVGMGGGDASFPEDPKPCKHSDAECIGKLLNYFAREKHSGDASLDLVEFDPVDVKKLHISRGEDSPVHIDLMLTNGKGYGLKTAKFINMTGFGKEISGKHTITAEADYLQLLSDYNITGQVLILPIRGAGKSNLTLHKPTFTIGWEGSPVEKNGATHMKVDKYYVDITPKGLTFAFENLFNDKALSDNMNKFLTENWSEVYAEIRASLCHGLALVTRKIMTHFFGKFPYDKLFVD